MKNNHLCKMIISKMYIPSRENLRYIKGDYMLSLEHKYNLVKELGDSAAILYEFFHEKRKYNYFVPTNDEAIAKVLGWTTSKVTRIKSLLKKHKYLLILKSSTSTNVTLYQILLGKDIVNHYKETGEITGDLELTALKNK